MANILLLEPDSILANLYMQAFDFVGHSTRRTVSAQDAVFHIDELLPDVVIVELQLVAHSGIEFLYELRSYHEWQHIPVLIHSCIPPTEFSDSMKLLCDKLGVIRYLYKPHTSLQTLLRSVAEAVGMNRADVFDSQRAIGAARSGVVLTKADLANPNLVLSTPLAVHPNAV